MAVDPRMMEFPHWAALTSASLRQNGALPTVTREDDWRTWAAALRQLPVWSGGDIPDPRGYATWQDWGARVSEAVQRLGQ